jgi:hypothetical protein
MVRDATARRLDADHAAAARRDPDRSPAVGAFDRAEAGGDRGGRPGRRPRHDVHLLEGIRLLREWRGVTHEVTVVDGGYEHEGKRYRSLSAVARAITGTQWSGPLFFGLRKTGSSA